MNYNNYANYFQMNEDLNNARQEVKRVKQQLEDSEAEWSARYNANDLRLSEKISKVSKITAFFQDSTAFNQLAV
jgi:hypothetical protein